MPARMNFDFHLGTAPARTAARSDDGAPMRILLMGDYGGRGGGEALDGAPLDQRRPRAVDVDVFEQVMRRCAPRLELEAAGGAIDFTELDDFHPDALYRRLPLFQALRDLRLRMQDPATFAAAAAEFASGSGGHMAGTDGASVHDARSGTPAEGDGATLERLLGRAAAAAPRSGSAASAQSSLDALIRSIVAPHIVPDAPAHQAQYLAALDAAISKQVNAILHAPEFQALESSWRGLHWLVTHLELDENLKLYVLDVTKSELLADVHASRDDLASSAMYRLLVEQSVDTPGAERWSLIVGNYAFGAGGEDVMLLATLGAVGSDAGAPFVAAAKPEVAGCASFAATPDPRDWSVATDENMQNWQALRESGMAPWIGLAAPRMLLRLPYGRSTDPIESFELEELGRVREHEHYLWGHPALACAQLIGRAFVASGWNMAPGDELDVDDLPAHTFDADGEKQMQACAEAYLTERAGQAMLERGLMPLLSYRNRNAVRVLRLQSIADPAQPLSGPWG